MMIRRNSHYEAGNVVIMGRSFAERYGYQGNVMKMVVMRPFTAEEPPSEAPLKHISHLNGRVGGCFLGKRLKKDNLSDIVNVFIDLNVVFVAVDGLSFSIL